MTGFNLPPGVTTTDIDAQCMGPLEKADALRNGIEVAKELDAEIAFESNDDCWDHIQALTENLSDNAVTRGDTDDAEITMARLRNALDWLHANGV